ncbi:MAG: hypothetical protein J4F28_08635 [Nitrosopumilaceae archaeon]|nr:hypothetical protein [Nitrosopumilaceae archaeon]
MEDAVPAAVMREDAGAPVSVDAFRDTLLLRAIHEAGDLAETLERIHKNPGLITSPEQLDVIDATSDKLNDHVRHGTAQVRQVLAAAAAAAAATAESAADSKISGPEAHL